MHSTVKALTDDAGARPDVAVRLAALALSAVADRAAELRRTGDEQGTLRWTETAAELLELARFRAAASANGNGAPQGPEGLAWLARAEAEWIRATAGPMPWPGSGRSPRSTSARSMNRRVAEGSSRRHCWRTGAVRRRPHRPRGP